MKFTSIFRREGRTRANPGASRKRPVRSFATSLASLERRALLASIGPYALSTSATMAVSSITTVATTGPIPLPIPPTPIGQASGLTQVTSSGTAGWTSGGGGSSGEGSSAGGSGGVGSSVSTQVEPRDDDGDRVKNRVSLTVAPVQINGVTQPEFAIADASASKVVVRVGFDQQSVVFGTAQGVDDPQSAILADLNGDGIPDLIIANTGADDVLVFMGEAGGKFGPEINGGKGFAVGEGPASVTVGDVNGDKVMDLVVANEASDSITVLQGQGQGDSWTATTRATIDDVDPGGGATDPVRTALVAAGDGLLDLFVCNSGTNDVYVYEGGPDGTFASTSSETYAVGLDPTEMFIGRFDSRPDVELVTINSGSSNISFISGILTGHPSTQTFSSGGSMPDAAIVIAPNQGGVLDLVVANGGDGRVALLQGSNDGMVLAGVITQANLPVPTGLASLSWNDDGLELYAASAGQDAAELLRFDLATPSTLLPGPLLTSTTDLGTSEDLVAGLLTFGGSDLELVAVFWAGPEAISDDLDVHESSMVTALYTPTEGQESDESTTPTPGAFDESTPPSIAEVDPSKVDQSACNRFVIGANLVLALIGAKAPFEAVADRDALEGPDARPIGELARLDHELALGRELEAGTDTVDEALRLLWSEGRPDDERSADGPAPDLDPDRKLDGIDAPAFEGHPEAIPLVSSAVVLSARLILKATPPRATGFLGRLARRASDGPDRRGPLPGRTL